MKQIKFYHNAVPMILDGTKADTWRLFDDKDLQVGDQFECVDKQAGEVFARAEITSIIEKTLGQIEDADFGHHERYASPQAMLDQYRKWYGDRVTMDTVIKMITFKLLKNE